jgi:hypothetical protein
VSFYFQLIVIIYYKQCIRSCITMRVLSVNVGLPRQVVFNGQIVTTSLSSRIQDISNISVILFRKYSQAINLRKKSVTHNSVALLTHKYLFLKFDSMNYRNQELIENHKLIPSIYHYVIPLRIVHYYFRFLSNMLSPSTFTS